MRYLLCFKVKGNSDIGESSIPEKSPFARHVCVGGRSKQDSMDQCVFSIVAKGRNGWHELLLKTFIKRNWIAANHWSARHRWAKGQKSRAARREHWLLLMVGRLEERKSGRLIAREQKRKDIDIVTGAGSDPWGSRSISSLANQIAMCAGAFPVTEDSIAKLRSPAAILSLSYRYTARIVFFSRVISNKIKEPVVPARTSRHCNK